MSDGPSGVRAREICQSGKSRLVLHCCADDHLKKYENAKPDEIGGEAGANQGEADRKASQRHDGRWAVPVHAPPEFGRRQSRQ